MFQDQRAECDEGYNRVGVCAMCRMRNGRRQYAGAPPRRRCSERSIMDYSPLGRTRDGSLQGGTRRFAHNLPQVVVDPMGTTTSALTKLATGGRAGA